MLHGHKQRDTQTAGQTTWAKHREDQIMAIYCNKLEQLSD